MEEHSAWTFFQDKWPILVPAFATLISFITFILIADRKQRKEKAEKEAKKKIQQK